MDFPPFNPEFEAILDHLKCSRGCNLTGYKRSTLVRRFNHRMQTLAINSYSGYLQHLKKYPEEHHNLLQDVFINFSSFFRDPDVWNYLGTEVIPQFLVNKPNNEPIRIWSAGCANGQEIFSLLMLMAEVLGLEACLQRVKCYATDIDKDAVQQAQRATYSDLEIVSLPTAYLQKYFKPTAQGYRFHSGLRRKVVFGHHDVVWDAPMSNIDLLICRNLLIYCNPKAQSSILTRFHFSLNKAGFLILGKAELLIHHRQIFTPVSLEHRVYKKGLDLDRNDLLAIVPKPESLLP